LQQNFTAAQLNPPEHVFAPHRSWPFTQRFLNQINVLHARYTPEPFPRGNHKIQKKPLRKLKIAVPLSFTARGAAPTMIDANPDNPQYHARIAFVFSNPQNGFEFCEYRIPNAPPRPSRRGKPAPTHTIQTITRRIGFVLSNVPASAACAPSYIM
jgi:hypothetical protein